MRSSYFLWAGTDAIEFLDDDDSFARDGDRTAAVTVLRQKVNDPRDWTLWERTGTRVRLLGVIAGDVSTGNRDLTLFV